MTAPTLLGPTTLAPTSDRDGSERVARHIRAASEATGVSFDFLLAQANQESRLDPDASNRRSSAMGLFQFTRGTWLEMIKKHGAEHGLGREAEAIRWTGKAWTIDDEATRHRVLDLRRDPGVSALMAAEYAKDNGKVLEKRLGRPASANDLYLAHFLGAGGAARMLEGVQEQPARSASSVLPKAAGANPELFRTAGRARSLEDLHAALTRRFDASLRDIAPIAADTPRAPDLAALRPTARPSEFAALRPDARPDPQPPTQQVAAADPDALAGQPYPVRLPPPVSTNVKVGGPVLRLLLKTMEDGNA